MQTDHDFREIASWTFSRLTSLICKHHQYHKMHFADSYCDHLASPNPWALGLSIFLVVGILFSYIPQHAKIMTNGTSAGLSPWWVLLGTLSSIAGLTNIVVLPTSQHDMACCREISGSACSAALLGIVQVGVQWICFMAIMVLFLVYFPRKNDDEQQDLASSGQQSEFMNLPKPRDAVIVAVSALVALLFAGLGSLFYLVRMPQYLLGWANFLGVTASILACVQYLPQIWTTYRLGQVLSLSIITMLVQVPGSFLFSFSLYLRVGLQGWSSWLVYCVTGVLQGCLLSMAITFWLRDRKVEQANAVDGQVPREADGQEHVAHETDPLLPSYIGSQRRPPNSSTLRTISAKRGSDNHDTI